jgi:ATP-dependent Clp protease protease subunit
MGVLEGPATDLDIEAREILRLRERLDQILAHHSGQELSKIQKDTDRNLWLSAEESVSYGLADQILQKAPEIVRADDKE